MTDIPTEAETSRYVSLPDARVHYNEIGSGPPLIFTVGYAPGTSAWLVYHRAIAALSRNFRCLLLDPPNCNKSDAYVIRGEARSQLYARVIRDFMDALEIDRATLVDMSFGGQTGQLFALDYPERLDRLVLHACGMRMPPVFWTGPSDAHAALGDAFRDPGIATLRRMMDLYLFDGPSYSDAELMLEERLSSWLARPELEAARKASDNIPLNLDHRLGKIAAQTLLLFGREDRVMGSPEGAIFLLNYLRDAQLVILNRCGHWIPFERPGEFSRLVADFVTNATPGR